MTKARPFKQGDRVRILRPRLIRRVGYPLHYKELRTEAQTLLMATDMTSLGFRDMRLTPIPLPLIEGLAKALVLHRGYGGNERSIHYYPIGEPIPDNQLWSIGLGDDDSFDPQPRPDPTGKIARVQLTYVRHTGTRVPGYSSRDWESGHVEWEQGYLADRKTHIILQTDYGDIESCDVELITGDTQ